MSLSKTKVDFTSGKIVSKLIIFVIPILITNLLQVFYNAADMMVVSLSGVDSAVGAIGTTGSFVSLIVNLFSGFSIGANIVVARHIGARDRDNTTKAVYTAVISGLGLGVVGSALGLALSRPILSAMGNEGVLLDLAITYTTIYFCGIPFISLTNFLASIFRAKGDSKTPLVILSLSGLLNVLLNLLFVLVFKLSVEGVALATSISNAVSAILLLILLGKRNDFFDFSIRNIRLNTKAFCDILLIGFPSAIQGALFSISNMLIQSSVVSVNNAMRPADMPLSYNPVVDANAATANLDGFIFTSMNSITHGVITFTSQNVGAKQYDRVKRILYIGYLISGSAGLIMSLFIMLLRTPLLALYGIDLSDEIAAYAVNARTYLVSLPYFLCGFMEIGSGVLRGLGRSYTSTIISLIGSCLLRVVWTTLIFPLNPCLENIFIAYPITWILTSVALHIFCITTMRRKRAELAVTAAAL